MRKLNFLKTLLVAVGLTAGASAWADEIVETYDFDSWGASHMNKNSYATLGTTAAGFSVGEQTMNKLTITGSKDSEVWDLSNRFAVSSAVTFRWGRGNNDRPRLGCENAKGTFYVSIVDLREGDKIVITGGGKFYSSNATYDVEGTATQVEGGTTTITSGTTYTMTEAGHLDLDLSGGWNSITKVVLTRTVSGEEITSAPVVAVSGVNGENRIVTITAPKTTKDNDTEVYYTTDGTEPTTAGTKYSVPFEVTPAEIIDGKVTVKAIAYKTGDTSIYSAVGSLDITDVGTKQSLKTPVIVLDNMVEVESVYHPVFLATLNATNNYGQAVSATLSYTFTPDGGSASAVEAPYTVPGKGVFKVTASAEGYESSEATFEVAAGYYVSYESKKYNEVTEESVADLNGDTWVKTEQAAGNRWSGWNDEDFVYFTRDGVSATDRTNIDNLSLRGTMVLRIGGGFARGNANEGNNRLLNLAANDFGIVKTYSGTMKGNITNHCFIGTGSTIEFATNGGEAIQQVLFYSSMPATVSKEIGTEGWATYVTSYPLDFSAVSGLEAYTATLSGTTVTLNKVENVAAGTAVVLKGAAKTYEIPAIASSATAKGDLKSGAVADVAADTENAYYGLYVKEGTARFAHITSGAIAADKAYLKVAVPAGGEARAFLTINDETTGINAVAAGTMANGNIYNLNGQRVAQPVKGLYIMDGKKVIKK